MTSGSISLEGVTKRYGSLTALNDVDLGLEDGAHLLVAGSNGAGKSTLLRLLCGLSRPTRGRVLIGGSPPEASATSRANIGLMSHYSLLYDNLTARENLLFFGALYGLTDRHERAEAALGEIGMTSRARQRVGTFSRGMKQRLALARATLHRPGLLLLDEPFEGLDRRAAQSLSRYLADLKNRGDTTVVVVTHRVDEVVDLVDQIAVLKRGRLCHRAPWNGTDPLELQSVCDAFLEEDV